MSLFLQDNMGVVHELEQMLFEFGHDIDINGAANVETFFEADGCFVLNGTSYKGHSEVTRYHAERLASIQAQHGGQIPASRHALTNIRVRLEQEDTAVLEFLAFFYAGRGTGERPDSIAASVVVDNRMVCRRDPSGRWGIKLLETDQILLQRA